MTKVYEKSKLTFALLWIGCYAVAIGFLFTLIFYKGKSLWPCILTHSPFNSLSAFSVEPDTTGRIVTAIALCAIPIACASWLLKNLKNQPW